MGTLHDNHEEHNEEFYLKLITSYYGESYAKSLSSAQLKKIGMKLQAKRINFYQKPYAYKKTTSDGSYKMKK